MGVYPLALDTNCTISSADTNGTTTITMISSDEPITFGEIIFTTHDQENNITAELLLY